GSVNYAELHSRLQDIYSQIDEPDGAEGITVYLQGLNFDQQILDKRNDKRWLAAQNWFSTQLVEDKENVQAQKSLLQSLKDHGQHSTLLSQYEMFKSTKQTLPTTLPIVIESTWLAGDWERLDKYLQQAADNQIDDFAVRLGSVLSSIRGNDERAMKSKIQSLRHMVAKGLTVNTVSSFRTSHESVLRLHALSELDNIINCEKTQAKSMLDEMDCKLSMLGGRVFDWQHILDLRRTAMNLW
ncbi:serine/threonine-protein kinase M1, partial [Ascosphaera atra]